jgi:hypothetical protein
LEKTAVSAYINVVNQAVKLQRAKARSLELVNVSCCEKDNEFWTMDGEKLGEFSHIFMEDVYWRTLQKTRELVKLLS